MFGSAGVALPTPTVESRASSWNLLDLASTINAHRTKHVCRPTIYRFRYDESLADFARDRQM